MKLPDPFRNFRLSTRLGIAFTPTMSLQFYGQPLIASGRYTRVRELARGRSLDFIPQGQGTGTWTYDAATGAFWTLS